MLKWCRDHRHIIVILLLGTLARLLTVWFAIHHPAAEWPVGGGNEDAVLARSLLAGHGLSSPFGGVTGPTAFVAPGYPILIAGIYGIFGPSTSASLLVVLLLQVVFSVATIVVTMNVAGRVFDSRTATIAGVALAFSLPTIWMPTIFWDTCLSTLLIAIIMALALKTFGDRSLSLWITMGVAAGLTSLVNPALLPALVAVITWSAYQQPRLADQCRAALCALLILGVVFVPWPIRNARALHAFIPLRSNLGFELWDGNLPGGNGKFVEEVHPYYNRAEFNRYEALGEVAYMQEKTSMAKATIKADPLRFVGISFKRVWDFWLGLAQPKNRVSGILVLHATLTSVGGAVGLLLLFRKHPATGWLFALPLLIFPLPYYLTHPDLRFRLLIDPLLITLGASAIVRLLAYLTVEPTGQKAGSV